ncbi:MAG TPA: ABC transporter permease [Casimicrobiaceae bacterium]|nr:ABC transporter permease [Casimicrobiaceae bacterium]
MSAGRIALWLLAGLLMVFLIAPIVVIVITSFNATPYMEFPPRTVSLRWYLNFFTSPHWYQTALLSLRVAVFTMIVATVLGTAAAIGIVRGRFPGRRTLEAFFVSPMVVPIVVIALGFYFLFSGYRLLNTSLALFLGHTVIATPLVVVIVRAALQTTNPAMEFAARSLGADFWRSLWYVTLPSVKAAIGSAAAFAFLVSFDDVVIAIFVAGPDSTTLPKRMWETIRFEIDPTLTAISSLLTMLAIIVLLAVELLRRSSASDRIES